MTSFVKRYKINDVLEWELYKSCLAWELVDRTLQDPECPAECAESDVPSDITVEGDEFVVIIGAK